MDVVGKEEKEAEAMRRLDEYMESVKKALRTSGDDGRGVEF
eukprot:CAMPEP_0184687004 /NCGR_PEP_ID=MMETSP0312-20130426/24821_1 /TAXON_ID=31354 /ORGANISM="Compsopogon coeruleus, Strain SAG 36.94" /LENGTH=40 /DNA_ID= /DNA_START= /DNA_END= /DNA_ORIENTATION=